jgi:creatinine amidohydrolase
MADSPSPDIPRLAELNADQVMQLAAAGAVVVLPISPLEEHGPHLPMGTDAFNAEHFACLVVELIREIAPSTPVLLAPLVPLGNHVFPFMGSINIRRRVIRDLVVDYGRSLAKAGFRRFVVVSAHGGPGHMVALDEAATTLTRYHRIETVNLTSVVIWRFLSGKLHDRISEALVRPLTAEERWILAHDYHAGWWETAMMLLLHPHLVDPSHRDLPDKALPLWRLRRFKAIRPPVGHGYLGAPARADADFARASLVVLREETKTTLRQFLAGGRSPRHFRSPLYRMLIFRTNFRRWVLAGLALLLAVAWMLLP